MITHQKKCITYKKEVPLKTEKKLIFAEFQSFSFTLFAVFVFPYNVLFCATPEFQ